MGSDSLLRLPPTHLAEEERNQFSGELGVEQR